ncbi:MAG: glycosyl hydrolase [Ignavibacteriales bacterium]|nr:glycosyl hydrolase [Ignavibacteriales bacterium]
MRSTTRLVLFLLIFSSICIAQKDTVISSSSLSDIKFRSIGPAFMSGRIADIAIHPENNNIWYVAVGSGGVWKTVNSGTTWEPIFDDQNSYSIGCVTIDPNNPNVIWVGTGENVGGRHVGYGDGIYKSEDGGKSWKNLGLKYSEHISKIIVNKENSNIIYVAAQGPLWSKGGERGFYKSVDGGKTWNKTLGDDEWIGVTDIAVDPRDQNLIYAATWQRHRNVASYMGGGAGSGIYKSIDGGETWEELKNGIPKGNKGKIGIAISPQKPDVIYTAIELDRRTGGVFKSEDRGASWKKMSETVSGATGPHYYQELYASPHQFDKIFLVDVRMQVSEDGGKTFTRMSEKHKHSDNHAIAFREGDPNYLLVGTDGGLYETFDNTETWRFINNLPVTQFYKVAVDDKEPFYNIYGGTQDNSTQGGPSRTDNVHGIRNSDWFLTLYADGHQPATEPGNPNIVYSEWQEGNLNRIDISTGEIVYIQPQPEDGEPYERFNWDAPILVSPHKPSRIYFASQRVWKSEDRGDSWTAISGDLTKNQERMNLPIMDKTWSWDAPWDFLAMSNYNTITSLAESPIKEGLIYAGTDDGIIQLTEDGGKSWRKIEVGELPGVPKTAFVNDIKADLYDANTVYVVLDNHKFGDYNPYLLKSADKGKTWKSIKSNLPERTLIWRIVQDHIKPNLMFVGTEFGIFFTLNGGEEWIKLKGGLPTISFRDLAIQRRENDLVGASFGRGFYILDDYSFLRDLDEKSLKVKEAELFTGRKAYSYIQRPGHGFGEKGSQGAGYFTAPNPPFGATFAYYLKDGYKSLKDIRQEKEKDLEKENKSINFPGWEKVEEERRQDEPIVWLIISDLEGKEVRKVKCENKKGFHQVTWDLRYPSIDAIDFESKLAKEEQSGFLAAPGNYSVSLCKQINGEVVKIAGPVNFSLEKLYNGALKERSYNEIIAFIDDLNNLQNNVSASKIILTKSFKRIEAFQRSAEKVGSSISGVFLKIHQTKQKLFLLDEQMNGNKSKEEIGEKYDPTITYRLGVASQGVGLSTYGPTLTHEKSLNIAKSMYAKFEKDLDEILNKDFSEVESELKKLGAPIVE